MTKDFIQAFSHRSIDEIIHQFKDYPLEEKSFRKSLEEISGQEGKKDLIDSDQELIDIAKLILEDYPLIARNFDLTSFDLKNLVDPTNTLKSPSLISLTDQESIKALEDLFHQLEQNGNAPVDFLGHSMTLPTSTEINNILFNAGSNYRCLIHYGDNKKLEINGVFGKILSEKRINKFPPAYQIILDTEKKYGRFKELDQEPLDNFGDQIFFQDSYFNQFIFRTETLTTIHSMATDTYVDREFFPYSDNTKDFPIAEIATDLIASTKNQELEILEACGELNRTIQQSHNNFFIDENNFIPKLLDRHDLNSTRRVLDLIKADIAVYQKILELSKKDPQKASLMLKLFITERYIPNSDNPLLQTDYQHRRISMFIGVSVISIQENQLQIDWDDLEKKLTDLSERLNKIDEEIKKLFKITFIGIYSPANSSPVLLNFLPDLMINPTFEDILAKTKKTPSTPSLIGEGIKIIEETIKMIIEQDDFYRVYQETILTHFIKINVWLIEQLNVNASAIPLKIPPED